MRGVDVVTTREPGGTPLGKRLRDVLLDAQIEVDPLAELLLFAADRAQHVRTLLQPAIEAGGIVMSDRYADATAAYHGAGRSFTPEVVGQVIEIATGGLKPDLTLVFDLPVAECLARTRRRTEGESRTDRLDAEDAAFHTRVRSAYLAMAEREPDRFRVINSTGSVSETHERVMEVVMPFLEKQKSGVRSQESE